MLFPVCFVDLQFRAVKRAEPSCLVTLQRRLTDISVLGAFCVVQLKSHSPNFSTTSPRCGTKNTSAPQGSVERSHTIQAGLLDTAGVSGDGHVWRQEDPDLSQWQQASGKLAPLYPQPYQHS